MVFPISLVRMAPCNYSETVVALKGSLKLAASGRQGELALGQQAYDVADLQCSGAEDHQRVAGDHQRQRNH